MVLALGSRFISAARHLLNLINDILDLSKIEAGGGELHPERLDVHGLCTAAIELVRVQAEQKGIATTTTVEPTVTTIVADPLRLKQILVNLLSNAVKFTPPGGRVDLRVTRTADPGLRFSVCDTGTGIDASDMPKLFQRFVQLDAGITRTHGGAGLGLALVRRLTELHGGRVSVESAPGAGSCFHVELPDVPAPADVGSARQHRPPVIT